jgi:hypothetical protein
MSSMDDIVLNAAGAGIGALLGIVISGSVIRGTPPQSIGAS